jgi:hypothetical protein
VDKLLGFVVFAAFAAGVIFYVYRSYAKMGTGARERWWGLASGERLVNEIFGEANIAISTGERVATAAAAAVAGALVGGIGIGSVRAPGVNFALTTASRMVVRVWRDDKHYDERSFARGAALARIIGPGSRRVQGGPSVVVQVVPRDGSPPVEALVHEGYAPLFASWT